ncbi:MAG: sigma-54-dependent transcriptional regulator, partial [Vicinamibacterales bacterium]
MAHILLVDDRSENRQSLRDLLARHGHEVQDVADARDAVNVLRDWSADLVLSDVRMNANGDGLTLLRTIKSECPQLPVILYTGFAQVGDAVLAIKLGAADYLEFPIDPEQLLKAVTKAVERRQPRPATSGSLVGSSRWPHDLVAVSPPMRAVLDWVARIAPTDLSVLLQGETGTGKELIARALHASSDRRTRPFVAVNCGAIPEGLFEAELFGYRKGAFTGAFAEKPGLVEEAHGGTLFLDEIGELPMLMQVRLLRFLEDGEVRRLGATKTAHLDVRVIAATNRVLNDDVAQGRFRSDVFFRLNTA